MGSEATRERILVAATAEFAAYGLAGARVDRIAAAADANKERIYAYFGDKKRLLGAVLRHAISRSDVWVPDRAEDLPAATGELFDEAFANPDIVRLLAWSHLESAGADLAAEDVDPYRAKAAAVRAAQASGAIDPAWDPADLLAIVGALVTAWTNAPAPLAEIAESAGVPVRDRRAAIEEAVRRIVRPEA